MLGGIGSNLMRLMNVLTPSEIDRYTKAAHSSEVRSAEGLKIEAEVLTQEDGFLKEHYKEDHDAQVLSFKNKKREKQKQQEELEQQTDTYRSHVELEDEEEVVVAKASGDSLLESAGIFSREKIERIKAEKEKIRKQQEESATVFLLAEREKLKESKNKIHNQKAISTYQKTSTQDFKVYLDDEGVPVETTSIGILINKKQA
jgi:UDP-N-acetylmuramyl pentapeptide synthase